MLVRCVCACMCSSWFYAFTLTLTISHSLLLPWLNICVYIPNKQVRNTLYEFHAQIPTPNQMVCG